MGSIRTNISRIRSSTMGMVHKVTYGGMFHVLSIWPRGCNRYLEVGVYIGIASMLEASKIVINWVSCMSYTASVIGQCCTSGRIHLISRLFCLPIFSLAIFFLASFLPFILVCIPISIPGDRMRSRWHGL
jgi:hypothetical protein